MTPVVVIPTYNEKDNIISLIESIRSLRIPNLSILVVDDNSPDGTAAAVRDSQRRFKDLFLISGQKEGIGRALLRGIDYAFKNLGADVIVQIDADFSHNPNDIPRLLAGIAGGYDLVVGSRYIKGGAIPRDWAFYRKVLSRGGNLLIRLFTGIWSIHEFTTNFRAFSTKLYRRMTRQNFEFADNTFLPAFVVEAYRCGARIKEVPIQFANRRRGRSKIQVFCYVPTLLGFCFRGLGRRF
jgi:dolichol-phosphate mannosyltransferase